MVIGDDFFFLWILFILLFGHRISVAANAVEFEQSFVCQPFFLVDEEVDDKQDDYEKDDAENKNSLIVHGSFIYHH